MKTRLYVDRDALTAKRAPIIVHPEGGSIEHAWEVRFSGPAVLKYQTCGPVPAKVWVETDSPVEIVPRPRDPCVDRE